MLCIQTNYKHSFCAAKGSSSYLAFLFKKCLEITVTINDSAVMSSWSGGVAEV